jgi:hypothetical protein
MQTLLLKSFARSLAAGHFFSIDHPALDVDHAAAVE